MPLFMENRFKIVIILIVFLTLIYGAEAIALSIDQEPAEVEEVVIPEWLGIDESDLTEEQLRQLELEIAYNTNTDVFSIISDFFGFITFAPLGLPAWAFWVVSLMVIIVLTTAVFIIASLVYDFVKALPLT